MSSCKVNLHPGVLVECVHWKFKSAGLQRPEEGEDNRARVFAVSLFLFHPHGNPYDHEQGLVKSNRSARFVLICGGIVFLCALAGHLRGDCQILDPQRSEVAQSEPTRH